VHDIIKHLNTKFANTEKLNDVFVGTPPYPMIVLDDFLPTEYAHMLEQEIPRISDQHWTEFTRRGSRMKECVKLDQAPVANEFVKQMHSQQGMQWLSKLTNITDLIPDPYIVGAGYSKSYRGDSLQVHTDFNWNEEIKLHRMLSFIIYLTSDWDSDWGGDLLFKDFNNKEIIQRVQPKFNRAVFWRHHKRGFHGYPEPLTCPEGKYRSTFRLFYYVSNASHDPNDRPHRSLYWFDEQNNEPYDIVTQK
jgi:hypothetical protein